MVASGDVPARRVGRQWLVDPGVVPVVAEGGVGRPLSERSCWAVLAALEGRVPGGFSRSELARARGRAGGIRAAGLSPGSLSGRSVVRHYYAHPGSLGRLVDSGALVRGGVSAAADVGCDLVAVGQVEGYLRSENLAEFCAVHGLLGPDEYGTQAPNVLLRVCHFWPFEDGAVVASPVVVAADLIDARDERSRRAGRDLLARALAGRLSA